jgi:hypothetical protein
MEHSIHIASKHFVEAVAPTSSSMICKMVKATLQWAKQNGNLDLDDFDTELAKLDINNLENGNRKDKDNDDFTVSLFVMCLIRPMCL